MLNSSVLDVAIGLAFIYLVLSVICTSLNEFIAGATNLRAQTLQLGIRNLLHDPAINAMLDAKRSELTELGTQNEKRVQGTITTLLISNALNLSKEEEKATNYLSALVEKHPLIASMGQGDGKPSYLDSSQFAKALIDTIHRISWLNTDSPPPLDPKSLKADGDAALAKLRESINRLPEGKLRSVLETLLDDSVTDVDDARNAIARWFDKGMDRVSGWYKRLSQRMVMICASLIAIGLCADTLQIAQTISHDSALRASISALASTVTDNKTDPNGGLTAASAIGDLQGLPLGWGNLEEQEKKSHPDGKTTSEWILWALIAFFVHLPGIAITTFAISLGAPFWFDTLNKFVNLRAAGRPPARAPEPVPPVALTVDASSSKGAADPSHSSTAVVAASPVAADKLELTRVGETEIWGAGDAVFYLSPMHIDACGAPAAYHPPTVDSQAGTPPGLDAWYNAEDSLVNGSDGKPYVQKSGDPAPGFYVTRTELNDASLAEVNPRKYVNSTVVPYMTLPESVVDHTGAGLGDLAMVFVRGDDGFDAASASFAVVAGTSADGDAGGGSIALARALDIYSGEVRLGHAESNIVYLVFAGSRTTPAWPRKLDEMRSAASDLFQKWGGMGRLQLDCADLQPPTRQVPDTEEDTEDESLAVSS